jgi:hypothetical protein
MKKFFTPLLLFVLYCGFYACVSPDSPNYSTVSSSITANENGTGWSATLTDSLLNDTLAMHAQAKRYLLKIKFPLSASNYNLASGNAQYFIFNNSGNITNTFKLDPTYANTVTGIVNNTVNSNNKYATGQFKARFIVDSTGVNTDSLTYSTVTFTNGQFTADYK